jgi:predicted CopG family antitoxin
MFINQNGRSMRVDVSICTMEDLEKIKKSMSPKVTENRPFSEIIREYCGKTKQIQNIGVKKV